MHNMFFFDIYIYIHIYEPERLQCSQQMEGLRCQKPFRAFQDSQITWGMWGEIRRSGLQSWGLWKADSYRLRVLRRTVGDAGDCFQISAIVNTEVWWSMCIFKLLPVAPSLVLKKSACSTRFYAAAYMLVAVNRCDNSTMTMPIFYLELHANTCLGELRGAKKEPLQLQSGEDSMIVCRRKFLQVVS